MKEIYEVEEVLGVKLNGAEFKGNDVCPSCRTRMKRSLKDIPCDFDWDNKFREKFKMPKYLICNQCTYHIILLLIIGLESNSIEVKSLVKAYKASMSLEDVFFDPFDLSCTTVFQSDNFQDLEQLDDHRSLYCQIFNNAYDLVLSGGAKSYFQTKNWPEVLTYRRGRFYKKFTKENL